MNSDNMWFYLCKKNPHEFAFAFSPIGALVQKRLTS